MPLEALSHGGGGRLRLSLTSPLVGEVRSEAEGRGVQTSRIDLASIPNQLANIKTAKLLLFKFI